MRCLEAQVNGRRDGVRSEEGVGEFEESVAPAVEASVERVAEAVESIGRFHEYPSCTRRQLSALLTCL
jgi:hypothetical protein